MDPTQCLRDEHEVILDVLACFEVALDGARDSGEISAVEFMPFVEFFRGYADRCHHQKEEDTLFPALERLGLPRDAGPVACMLDEHRVGRAHVSDIAGAICAAERGNPAAVATLLSEGGAFIDLLRDHIDKENNALFDMAGQMIQGEDAAELIQRYHDIESDADYVRTASEGRAIAERLARTYRRTGD